MLTRRKEEFIPIDPPYVGMYVCGPTVYDYSHMGHAKCYVSFDVIVKYLRYKGYKVKYVQNITDVGHMLGDVDIGEDKIISRAKKERVHPMELVEKYMREYFYDMDALGVARPDISPRPSGHIPEIIEAIEILIKKGYAYEVNGSVYFDVSKFPEYGKLSGRRLDKQLAGARISPHPDKRSPYDFALWIKAPKGHILQWRSPWGWGYPGWHIECSIMSMKYLGETLDIHGGGVDNIFPHNECEIAQSEALTGKQFVKYWLLNGSILVDGEKMSKSKGNFVTIKDALKDYSKEAIRHFILSSHYRSPTNYTKEGLEGAKTSVNYIREFRFFLKTQKPKSSSVSKINEYLEQAGKEFETHMDDDFNTPRAIAVVHETINWLFTCIKEHSVGEDNLNHINNWLETYADRILGILPPAEEKSYTQVDELVEILIQVRAKLRSEKNWVLADYIRERLQKLGIELRDTKDGTVWKYKCD